MGGVAVMGFGGCPLPPPLTLLGKNTKIGTPPPPAEGWAPRHWRVCGSDKFPPIIARGVLLDIAALRGVDVLPASYGIGAQDLQDAARRQQVALEPGDVVLVRTGRMRCWPDHDAYLLNE